MIGRLFRKPLTWVIVAVLGLGAAFGLYWFTPWKAFTSKTVNEALASPPPVAQPTSGPVVIATGILISHEHTTSGEVRIVRKADGSRQLELVNLSTSDGPDLRVWLTDQAVVAGTSGWKVFDDGRYTELGALKGNKGNQAYAIPQGLDLGLYRSVSIWCKRFSISFGAAELDRTAGG
jgi:hypothetical protein